MKQKFTERTEKIRKESERALAEGRRIIEAVKDGSYVPGNQVERQDAEGFEYVPSIGLYFAKERTHLGENWDETHKALSQETLLIPNTGEVPLRMPKIPEFIESLNYFKENNQELYDEITQIRSHWKGNWLDAYFEQRDDGLYILTDNKTNAEKLESCLMENCQADILNSANSQGLPTKKEPGFYYWKPKNGRVAWFDAGSGGAYLGCDWGPSSWSSSLGVFAVAQTKDGDARPQTDKGSVTR